MVKWWWTTCCAGDGSRKESSDLDSQHHGSTPRIPENCRKDWDSRPAIPNQKSSSGQCPHFRYCQAAGLGRGDAGAWEELRTPPHPLFLFSEKLTWFRCFFFKNGLRNWHLLHGVMNNCYETASPQTRWTDARPTLAHSAPCGSMRQVICLKSLKKKHFCKVSAWHIGKKRNKAIAESDCKSTSSVSWSSTVSGC